MSETKWNFNETLILGNPDSPLVDNKTGGAALDNLDFDPYEGLISYDLNSFCEEDKGDINNEENLPKEINTLRHSMPTVSIIDQVSKPSPIEQNSSHLSKLRQPRRVGREDFIEDFETIILVD